MEGVYGDLMQLSWRDRGSLPPWDGPRWMRAARVYARFRRKVRRAVGEPTITTPLFSG